MYNAWRGKDDRPLTPQDFLPKEEQSEEEKERESIEFFERLASQYAAEEQARLSKN